MTEQKIPEDSTNNIRPIEITHQPVELYKILKFEGLVSSGAEAKAAVASGLVLVNGQVEIQKRKKIMAGDVIEFETEKLLVELSANTESSPDKAPAKPIKPIPPLKRAAIPLARRGK